MDERNHKIVNVLETYFSDASLLWDKIMLNKIMSNPEGMVSFTELAQLSKFKSLKVTPEEIKENAEKYCLTRLQLSQDKQKIGRIKPFVKDKKEELDEWSIYVEGLTKPYNTETAIKELFNSHVGHVSFFRIPPNKNARYQPASFYGYCFIEFDDKKNVEKAIQLFNRYGNSNETNTKLMDKLNLRIMSKIEWNRLKEEYVELLEERKGYFKRVWDEYNAEENKEEEEESNKKADIKVKDHRTGTIVFVDGLHPKSPKTIAISLLETSNIKIEYMSPKKKGLTSVYIRLRNNEDATQICDYFMQHHFIIQQDEKDTKGEEQESRTNECIKLRLLTESEEKIYWENDKR
ncbi:uncharacterized protein BX663DRAFT_512782 [Cokeromyces recurvatus]|uniref:uncharacterized protein n=1 Tax=Cokeromyces recurvatus TaxID=90255 RepID=UPI0022212471|nr:uncharacterized protein BX663DRAFT_512782 [Cokeromyces recurvatus]KAI7901904.1 hypothetical protein BX663DRAFT_512782 [Cokeromyces recurvatus]